MSPEIKAESVKKIAVGSKNPVKVAAVTNVIKKIWPAASIESMDAPSGVSEQPRSEKEAILGALNRAQFVLAKTRADVAFGLEGNVVDTDRGMFCESWVVALHRDGRSGVGGCGRLELPDKVGADIRAGMEQGPAMDKFIGGHNTKQGQGSVGILTSGLVDRTTSFERGVIYALAKFINPGYYN